MSEVYICITCNNIYSKENIIENENGIAYCPNALTSCGNNLISVDESLADLILKFWSADDISGIGTSACCEGHLGDLRTPYIVFCRKLSCEKPFTLRDFGDLIETQSKKVSNIVSVGPISTIGMKDPGCQEIHQEKTVYEIMCVRGNPNKYWGEMSVVEKLHFKADFIAFMHCIINELALKAGMEK